MCSFSVRQARSGAAATPDAFFVGATSTTAGVQGIGTVAAAAGCTAADGFAWLTIPNIFTADSTFCGGVLANTAGQTEASPVTGKIICTIEKIGQAIFKKFDQLSFIHFKKLNTNSHINCMET